VRVGGSGARVHWLVIGPFLAVLALMVVLAVASTSILSAVRAYVGAESMWSKGQKDAVYQLANYARSHDAADYARFRLALAVPLGDRQTRTELQRADPDLSVARAGLRQGGNHPDDIGGMVWLFRYLGRVDFMAKAIAIWAEGDVQIAALDRLASRIHQQVLLEPGDRAQADPAPMRELLLQLAQQNDRLTQLELRFSATLGDASRIAIELVILGGLLFSLTLGAGAVALSLRPLRAQARSESALRESEERLTRALDASDLALWDLAADSGRIFLSESWSRLLGGRNAVTRTTLAGLLDLVPPEEQGAIRAEMARALNGDTPSYRIEHRVRKHDGTWLWNLSEGRVVQRAPDGRALRMVGTNRDITERIDADAARQALEAQLRESQKMEAIGTLAGGIAHDFNNILGAILGNVTLARDDIGRSHPAQASLLQIKRAAGRARGLVQQILAFSRRQPQALTLQALGPLMSEAVALLRSTLPAHVRLDTRLCATPMQVNVDATQIEQVLINLCTNAWHALQGRAGRVGVGAESVVFDAVEVRRLGGLPAGRYAHLWVSDDGCGMDPATQARIFEPFFTTKPVGQGTGLGLAVAHGIAATHGGAITVQSEVGVGSTFHLYLPLTEAVPNAGAPDAPSSAWGSLGALAETGQGQHVLCVDDDEVMLVVVERLLQRFGYRVTCHSDPRRALAALREAPQSFDLLLSDFNMPQCSGLELARAAARVRADLPVVISSGYITEALSAEMRQAGVRGVINKERTVEELGALVATVLAAPAMN
jgi:PAS domain S-box-containing protein